MLHCCHWTKRHSHIPSSQPVDQPSANYFTRNEADVITAVNKLAYLLQHQMTSQKAAASVCFAPFNIAATLFIVMGAMSEENASSLLNVLGLRGCNRLDIFYTLGAILKNWNLSSESSVRYANTLGIRPDLKESVASDLYTMVQNAYQGKIFSLQDIGQINEFVAQQTHGEIPSLLQPDDLKPDALAVIVNTIHVSVKWRKMFEETSGRFICTENRVEVVKMIQTTDFIGFYETDHFQMAEIPFQSSHQLPLSCVFFLPTQVDQFFKLEKQLTPDFVQNCRDRARSQEVKATIPMMDIQAKQKDLLEMLKTGLGLPLESPLVKIDPRAVLSQMIHHTVFKIDREGATAAAAAFAEVGETCCPDEDEHVESMPTFMANHSFFFFLVGDKQILFQGSVNDFTPLEKVQ